MGYYTDYTLEFEVLDDSENKPLDAFIEECKLKEIEIPETVQRAINDKNKSLKDCVINWMQQDDSCQYGQMIQFVGGNGECCKWYEHDEEMLRVSMKFPQVLFTLRGEGEEHGDLWVKYYLAGKTQCSNGVVTFDPFDKDKLK